MPDLPSGTVTFVFTDLVVSTRLWEQERDAMSAALARHDEILRDAIAAHGGTVVKGRGDGVHAVFPTAAGAVRAAIDGQLSLRAEAWPVSEPLLVRVGIHTGVAELRDGDYFGSAVNRAARLEGIAHGGQIVMSHATEALVRDELGADVELVDLGEHRLRDLLRAERVFQVRAAGLVDAFPVLQSLDTFPSNLPAQLTSFVGRDEELAALAKALDESRLVTLTGVGGVGKTRLALQLAVEVLHQFADGAWLCELATTNDPDALGQVIVAELAVQPRPGRSLLESACDYLSGKQALIVLDNCEHLLDAAAEVADAILHAAPGVRVVATSRELLGVPGERVVGVRSLRLPSESGVAAIAACEAVRLFVDRAEATRSGFCIDDANADPILEICTRLDGIPLAVELAAARVTSMAPREIAGLLDERFRLLTGGRRRGIERHQTLRATVEWSYSLLGERERLVFDRLAVFAGSFDADAASAVAGDADFAAWDVRDALDDLTTKSMLDVFEDGPDGSTRFRLLETLRQYALERLDDSGQTDAIRRRHAEHYAAFAEVAGPALHGPDEVAWAPRFEADLDNLRAAVAWSMDAGDAADVELGLRIVSAFVGQEFSRPSAGVGEWAGAALEHAETSNPGCRTAVLAMAAWTEIIHGDADLGRMHATEALRSGLPPDAPAALWARAALASAELTVGDYPAAFEVLEDGERVLDTIDTADVARLGLETTTVVANVFAGRAEEARARADALVRRARTLANPSRLGQALRWLAETRRPDEIDDTLEALEECLALSRAVAIADHVDVAQALGLLAKVRARRGECTPAAVALREAVVRSHDTGSRFTLLSVILNYALSAAADLDALELAATLGGVLVAGPLTDAMPVIPHIRTDREAALERVRAEMANAEYDAAFARGAAMSYEEVVAYTLAELDQLRYGV